MHFPYQEGLLLLPRTNDWPYYRHGIENIEFFFGGGGCGPYHPLGACSPKLNRFKPTNKQLEPSY